MIYPQQLSAVEVIATWVQAIFISGFISWFILWWLLRLFEKSDSISRMNYWILLISLWIVICFGVAYLLTVIYNLFEYVEPCQKCKSKYN